jgi:hypothetical protein
MNLKKLEKATKILEQIKKLDAEILELDRFAIKVANRDTDCNVSISLVDKSPEVKREHIFGEYGFLKPEYTGEQEKPKESSMYDIMHSLRMGWFGQQASIKHVVVTDCLQHKLSDKETLQILGILLGNKHDARALLIKALNQMGVEI